MKMIWKLNATKNKGKSELPLNSYKVQAYNGKLKNTLICRKNRSFWVWFKNGSLRAEREGLRK